MVLIVIMAKIALLCSNSSILGKSGHKTGVSLLELAPIVYELERAGHRVELISPSGGIIPIDPGSVDFSNPIVRDYHERKTFLQRLEDSIAMRDVKGDWDAFVACGGWSCIGEFVTNDDIGEFAINHPFKHYALLGYATSLLLQPAFAQKFAQKKITAPMPTEDQDIGASSIWPLVLSTELKSKGYEIVFSKTWARHTIDSGILLTGQNVFSAQALGELLVKNLNAGVK